MGATISTFTDKFFDEKVVTVDTKNFNFWEWSEQEKFFRRNNIWHELKQGNRMNHVAALVKGISENSKINRNILYLVRRIVSIFYEEALDHQTQKLEEAYEQNQRDAITIDEFKAKLAAMSKTSTSLKQKSKVNISAEKEPIFIEDEDITISSMRKGSTSTIDTNDMEVVHMETGKDSAKPQITEKVKTPDESSTKKKHKKKEFTPYIITGHTVPPKLKANICKIMLYDVPGDWDAEQIIEAINKDLGSLLKATLRKQDKYYSVRASIVLRTKRLEELEVHQTWQTVIGINRSKLLKTPKQRKEKKSNSQGNNNRKSNSNKKNSDKKKSKDTSSSKKNSNKKRGGIKQDSVADILAKALAKIIAGQEKSKSRKGKKNKVHGSSRS
ncbi:hypothetical protein C1645_813328 [Glomus cerebriforme]|uniref:Uncharacterized protein n=1 Tax=Glomus cerebriforme TaxID=658196 RepID=A0A397TJF4_9GLOM|nr:hypothetical protein C1645_813328 [Glomus cerebriforme]